MKKVISLLLCIVMLGTMLVGCSSDDDNGATIPVYLSTPITSLDPALSLNDEAALKVIGLIYEGLTKLNAKGKVVNSLIKKWTYEVDTDNNIYEMEIQLNYSCWSDGRQVSAQDFVYAWKRIMEPSFQSEAAAMLMDIKNAKQVRAGDASIDDLGVVADDITVLTINFERDIDPELFLEYCASPALYPLREDAVNKAEDWSTNSTILQTNGPFTVRRFNLGDTLVLERNIYYRRTDDEQSVKKFVTPYRLTIDLSLDSKEALALYEEGKILYMNELPLEKREEYKKKATVQDTLNTHTYFFNTTKAPFDNADVRRGLSMAIDRQALANIVVFAKAAEGFVAPGVGVTTKSDFRKAVGNLFSNDMAEAKKLTSGASEKSFEITIKENNEVDRAVAEYCVSQWKQLGFDVTIRELGTSDYVYNEYDLFEDQFTEAYIAKDFDVIAIDWQTLSTDPWSTLAPFAKAFSGSAMDLVGSAGNVDFETEPHITGYNNQAYNEIIDRAFAETDRKARAEILKEAEKLLAQDMPVMPLFVYQDYYLASSKLSLPRERTSFWGYRVFNKLKFKGYKEFESANATAES